MKTTFNCHLNNDDVFQVVGAYKGKVRLYPLDSKKRASEYDSKFLHARGDRFVLYLTNGFLCRQESASQETTRCLDTEHRGLYACAMP